MKEKLKQLFGLFGAFAVVGVTTFGGGYAMLPALQREVVEKRRWATEEEVMDWYAIGQCTPGVIAVNTATFVGQKQAGIWGGIFATLGVVFPSLVIIMHHRGLYSELSRTCPPCRTPSPASACACACSSSTPS